LPVAQAQRIRALIERAGLPIKSPAIDADRWLDLMSRDKKTAHRATRFVLLTALGEGVVRGNVDAQEVNAVLRTG
jgi:3-dehydroquinate synthetase